MSRRARLSTAGPRAQATVDAAPGPVRTCVGCRARDSRSTLVRLVLDRSAARSSVATPDTGRLVVDVGRRLPGRGAWLHASSECLAWAERRRALPRALRVAGPLDLDAVREHLDRSTPDERRKERRKAGTDATGKAGRTTRIVEKESGLEADGHPMSTQR